MTPRKLAKYPTEILELALEMKEIIKKETVNNKIDLSKIPDDVLDMAIEIRKEKEENYQEKIIQESDKIVEELDCKNVFEALDKIKQEH